MIRRRYTTALLIALLLTVSVAAVTSRQYLWTRLVVLPRARAELSKLDYSIDVHPLPDNVQTLVDLWQEGDRTLAELLLDDNGVVWVRAAEVLECWLSGAAHMSSDWENLERFRLDLCELGPHYAIRYHLLGTVHSFIWRSEYFTPYQHGDGTGKFDWRCFWTAEANILPSADPRVIAFLTDIIFNWDYDYDDVRHRPLLIRSRAVDALVAGWAGAGPGTEAKQDSATVLRRIIASDLDPELPFRALCRVIQAEDANPSPVLPDFHELEQEVGLAARDMNPFGFDDEDLELTLVDEPDTDAIPDCVLQALTLMDHPRTTGILRRLEADEEIGARIEKTRGALPALLRDSPGLQNRIR